LKIDEKSSESITSFLVEKKERRKLQLQQMVRLVGHVVLESHRWRAATSSGGEKALECIPVKICKEFRYFLFHERATHGQRQPSRSVRDQ